MLSINGKAIPTVTIILISHTPHRDRRKLTFYFIAEKRIDFRELVRELFRQVLTTQYHCCC